MELQRQLSNGQWIDCGDRAEEFIGYAIDLHGSLEAVENLLRTQKSVRYKSPMGQDWYDNIRLKPAPRPAPPPPQRLQCKSCGEWLSPSRFTTLPESAQTCDDCV